LNRLGQKSEVNTRMIIMIKGEGWGKVRGSQPTPKKGGQPILRLIRKEKTENVTLGMSICSPNSADKEYH